MFKIKIPCRDADLTSPARGSSNVRESDRFVLNFLSSCHDATKKNKNVFTFLSRIVFLLFYANNTALGKRFRMYISRFTLSLLKLSYNIYIYTG